MAVFLPPLIACLGFMAIVNGVFAASIMTAIFLIMIAPLYAATFVSGRKRIAELRKALESL